MAVEFKGTIAVCDGIVEVRIPFDVMFIADVKGDNDISIQHDERSEEIVISSLAKHKARAEFIEQNRTADIDEKE